MDFKMKENVNFNSLVLKKKILGETLEIITSRDNYTITDLQFALMIGFVNAIVEENVIVYCLADEDKLIDRLTNDVEPLFIEHIINNAEAYDVYVELTDEFIDYMEREHENNLSIVGVLNSIINVIGDLDISKLLDVFMNVANAAEDTEKEKEVKPLTVESAMIESDKMKDLISQFVVNKSTNTIK